MRRVRGGGFAGWTVALGTNVEPKAVNSEGRERGEGSEKGCGLSLGGVGGACCVLEGAESRVGDGWFVSVAGDMWAGVLRPSAPSAFVLAPLREHSSPFRGGSGLSQSPSSSSSSSSSGTGGSLRMARMATAQRRTSAVDSALSSSRCRALRASTRARSSVWSKDSAGGVAGLAAIMVVSYLWGGRSCLCARRVPRVLRLRCKFLRGMEIQM